MTAVGIVSTFTEDSTGAYTIQAYIPASTSYPTPDQCFPVSGTSSVNIKSDIAATAAAELGPSYTASQINVIGV